MKRFFCFLFVVCLIIVNCSVSCFAADSEKGIPVPYKLTGSVEYDSVKAPKLSGNMPVYYYEYVNGKPVWNAYSMLNDNQKKVYDAVVNAPVGTLNVTIDFPRGDFLYSDFDDEFFLEIMYAICNDRPDLYYYNGYAIEAYLYDNDYLKSISYSIGIYSETTYNPENIVEYHTAMTEAMALVPVDLSNRYNFVKSLHDYLCDTIYYPDVTTDDYIGNAHDAYGALVEQRAVCQGYAESFKMICDYYKIPCVTITGYGNGGPHMWNAVQMDDGLWYFIDATWNDQTEKPAAQIFYDFFLVGYNTKDTYFGGNAFSKSHVADTDIFLPMLNYATEKYDTNINHFTGFDATYNSYTVVDTDKYLIRSFYDMDDSYVYYDGMYVEVITPATNSQITVPGDIGGVGENWTLVLIGDCNGDGLADASDYGEAVNKVVGEKQIETVYDYAADADCDGCLDVVDLSILERAVSGMNTEIKIEN